MKKLIILLAGLSIFLINILMANECAQIHDTHNVGHQFYEALVATPKDAIVKGAVATKELGKDVAAAVSASTAKKDLKDAAKELVIEAPVKTAQAFKNGTLKAVEGTKNGAKAAYNIIIRKPAHKIKDVAHQVANSDFVQGTKEGIIDLGEQFADAGNDLVDASKSGAHKVYHVMIEKPAGAIKAAAHYLVHGSDEKKHECTHCDACVMVLPAPLLNYEKDNGLRNKSPHVTTIAVMPMSWVNSSTQTVVADNTEIDEEIDLEFIMDSPCQLIEDRYTLSEKTIKRLIKAYQSLQDDIITQR